MNPTVVAEAKAKARDYFSAKGTLVPVAEIQARLADAFGSLEAFLAPISAAAAARTAIPGEWSIQEIVDHLVETHRPGLDELWCLLAGRRPPGEPIPASLQSKSPRDRPWSWLCAELVRIHGEILRTLAAVPADFATDARAPIVMVVNVPDESGRIVPLHWVEDLDWKAYAIVWRLHVIDHLRQARKVLAAVERLAMALAATETELQGILDGVAFTRSYGFRLHAIDEGRCTLAVPFQSAFERPGGIVSGQVFMAAADVAMWLAIMTRLGPRDGSVTAGMTTAFLGAARRESFRCTAQIVKLGQRLIYGTAESVTDDGRLVAHHSLTYARAAGG